MNNLQHIPLDEILLLSFHASDAGDNDLAEALYSSFISTKDKAIKLAEKAAESGDLDIVDTIFKSIEKAKEVTKARAQKGERNTNFDLSLDDPINNKCSENLLETQSLSDYSNDKGIKEDVDVNNLARNMIMEFQQNKSNNKVVKKHSKKYSNHNLNGKSFNRKNTNIDTLLKKYLKEEKFNAAEKRANKLLLKEPNSAYLHNYLGVCLTQQNRFDDAKKAFDKSILIEPNAHDAIYNKALINLRFGYFDKGWELYEAGLNHNIREVFQEFLYDKTPFWDGKPFDGTLLVYGEQSISEQIMFSTIIDDLLKVHQNIILVVDGKLKNLLQRTYENIQVIGSDENKSLLEYNQHIPMGSLCKFFRKKVGQFNNGEIKNIISSFEIDKQTKFLFPDQKGLKIGISWMDFDSKHSSESHLSDEDVSEIIKFGDHTFINLQFGTIDKNLEEINQKSSNSIHQIPGVNLGQNLDSYASIINNCDLVISVDNMTAHLAASLGKPVWVLLPANNNFRWMEKTENSIWYKNVLLLRKELGKDWSKIIGYINSALG